jgi:hypothetical protein
LSLVTRFQERSKKNFQFSDFWFQLPADLIENWPQISLISQGFDHEGTKFFTTNYSAIPFLEASFCERPGLIRRVPSKPDPIWEAGEKGV